MSELNMLEPFLKVLTENVQASATIATEVRNVVEHLRTQEAKIDAVSRQLVEIQVEQRGFRDGIDGLKKQVEDHEGRLRTFDNDLETNKNTLTKVLATSAALLIVAQILISVFVAPLVQTTLFR